MEILSWCKQTIISVFEFVNQYLPQKQNVYLFFCFFFFFFDILCKTFSWKINLKKKVKQIHVEIFKILHYF